MLTKSTLLSVIAVFIVFTTTSSHSGDIISCDSFEMCADGNPPLTNYVLELEAKIAELEAKVIACPCITNWRRTGLFPDPENATYLACVYNEATLDGGWVQKNIYLQIGDSGAPEPYGQISALTENVVGKQLSQCESYSGLEWKPDDLEGGVQQQNFYPEGAEIFEQMQGAFYQACFQEVVKIAEQFGINCVPYE